MKSADAEVLSPCDDSVVLSRTPAGRVSELRSPPGMFPSSGDIRYEPRWRLRPACCFFMIGRHSAEVLYSVGQVTDTVRRQPSCRNGQTRFDTSKYWSTISAAPMW